MIVVKLIGGLGNQMFQYAAGLRLARHHGSVLKLDLTGYKHQENLATPRRFELNSLNISAGIADPADLPTASRLLKIKSRLTGHAPLRVIKEKNFRFDSNILEASDNSYLDGFWQSEEYFKDQAEAIRTEFKVKNPPNQLNGKILDEISKVQAVSLHVRRGDYVKDKKTNLFHGISSIDYYRSAIKLVAQRVPQAHLFIFSDEPDWCKANLKFTQPTTYVDHNSPDQGFEDMRLMTACQHHIIANSSFSWWGAWLDPRPAKIVIAPKNWFQDPSMDASDVVPDEWIKL